MLEIVPVLAPGASKASTKKASKSGPATKISHSHLSAIDQWRTQQDRSRSNIYFDIQCFDTDAVAGLIRSLGGEIIDASARYQQIRANTPIDKIIVLAELDLITKIKEADRAYTK